MYPSEEVEKDTADLRPAMALRSRITHVKTLPAGEGIGYGWTYTTTRETKVATIPTGYADGYKRALSNQGRVLIHGISAPIIGRVCMDQFMVDVTDVPNVKVGDMATLFGRDGNAWLPVEELANASASFNYEFVCGLTRRVPRIYTWHGKVAGVLDYLAEEPYEWFE